MKIPNLSVEIISHAAEPPPQRKLVLTCRLTNSASFDICVTDAWIRVEALNGLLLAEGRIFQAMHNRVDPAIIPAGKQGLGAFHIELPTQVIHDIERRRAGGDVKFTLSSRVIVSEISASSDVAILKLPYETQFGITGSGYLDYLIPQSEWIKLLKGLGWSELEILELPTGRLRTASHLIRALERFNDAQQNYRNGDWEETMLNCRKAFEAVVQDATGELNMSKAHQVYVSLLGEGEKTERFDRLAKHLGDFLHLGRHENPIHVSIKRADAELSLILTGALLIYLSQ